MSVIDFFQTNKVLFLEELNQAIDQSLIVGMTDPLGKIIYANPAFCRITGYKKEELIGKDHRILNSGYHSKEFMKDLWDTLKSGKSWAGIFKNKKKDGTFYWVKTYIMPIKDTQGDILRYLSLRQDITKEKELSEQLVAASKLSGLGELASQIVHEVANPLTTISVLLQSLKREIVKIDMDKRVVEKKVGQAQISIEKVLSIFNNMRATLLESHGESHVSLPVSEFLVPAVELVRPKLSDYKIELIMNSHTLNFNVMGNKTHLSQVFINLLNNAAKIIQNFDEKWIEIQCQLKNDHVFLRVMDSGYTKDIESKNRLFDFLFTTDEKQGTGLGLSISRQIVEKHHGEIFIDEESEHTCFVVKLPITENKVG